MRLIQDEEYERLRQKQVSSYNPELRVLTHLEDEMRDIMDSKNISPDDKLKLFEQLRQRSNEIKNQAKSAPVLGGVSSTLTPDPPTVPAVLPGPAVVKVEVKKEEPVLEEIIGRISSRHKKNANKLIELINSNPDIITSNDKEELVFNGKSIPNTKFTDLFTSLFSERQSKSLAKLEGVPSFLKALNSLHVPSNIISNLTLSKGLEDLSVKRKLSLSKKPQAGKGFNVPGKIQRILRVYHV